MPATRLILVRHSETIANRSYRHIGNSDEPLSEHGIEQAQQLAEALAVLPIQAVYSSPLQRAYHTALPIAERLKLEVRLLDALREGSFGAWEGLTHAEIIARSEEDARLLRAWEQDATLAPPGGESLVAIQQRTSAAIEQLAHQHPGQTIALISHVGPIKALLCAALGAPPISAFRIFLDPATISVIDWRDSQHAIVRLVNSHVHLGWASARWITS
jgi:broad specificity phosphatase PhoE